MCKGSLLFMRVSEMIFFHMQWETISSVLVVQNHVCQYLICEILFLFNWHMIEMPLQYWVKEKLIWHAAIGRKNF